MKLGIRNIILMLMAGCLFACQKNVSVSEYYPDTQQQPSASILQSELAGIYEPLASDPLYAQGFFGYLNAGADESFRNGTTATTVLTELYDINSSEPNVIKLWQNIYQGVERANVLLSVVDNATGLDSATKRDYKGEATFLRAYYFYLLVSEYGDIPLKIIPSSQMGTNFTIPRDPTKKVYDFVISEMTAADTLVKTMPTVNSTLQVTQTAVEAVLARVCLSAAGYPLRDTKRYTDALFWANKVINSGVHGLYASPHPNYQSTPAYARVFINNMQNNVFEKNNLEDIWDISFLSKSNTSGTYANTSYPVTQTLGVVMGIYDPIASSSAVIGYSGGTYRAFPKLYNLYGSGDLRRDWAIAPFSYKDASTTKYPYLTVNFTGGGGTGATATAYTTNTGGIASVVIDNPGSGYTSAPVISFTSYNNGTSTTTIGTGAAAKATVANGKVTSVTVVAPGANYATVYDHCIGKWRRQYEVNLPAVRSQNYTSCNFPVIRYADVLLMAAEADFMLNGATTSAIENVNQVRRRAYGLPVTLPSSICDLSTITMQDIMDERSRELCFEGLRRNDLIRWGVMSQSMQNLMNDNLANSTSAYLISSTLASTNFLVNTVKYSVLPIPSTEISNDPALVQNPGW